MDNTITINPESIRAVVRKKDAIIIYTVFDKFFVCTNENPKLLKNGMIVCRLKGGDQQ